MATQKDMQERSGTPVFRTLASIVRTEDVTPHMRRITLGGEGLSPLLVGNRLPADAIKLYLPQPGKAGFMPEFGVLPTQDNPFYIRAYTIRHFRHQPLELDIDIVLHGDSPGSVWAQTVQPGDQVGFVGPRHDDPGYIGVDWLLYAGDDAAVPAIAAIVEQLPATARAYLFLEVTNAADEIPITTEADVTITWLHRNHIIPGKSNLLEQAIRNFAWPDGKAQAWLGGETGAVRAVRRYLQNERRMRRENIHASGYWRYGLDNQEFDMATIEEYKIAVAAGKDIHDHHDVDTVAAN